MADRRERCADCVVCDCECGDPCSCHPGDECLTVDPEFNFPTKVALHTGPPPVEAPGWAPAAVTHDEIRWTSSDVDADDLFPTGVEHAEYTEAWVWSGAGGGDESDDVGIRIWPPDPPQPDPPGLLGSLIGVVCRAARLVGRRIGL